MIGSTPARIRGLVAGVRRLAPVVMLLVIVAIVLTACTTTAPSGTLAPGATPTPVPTIPPPLHPANPGADPVSLVAFLFTPIFQALLILLVGLYDLFGAIGIPGPIGVAIIAMTLIIRAVLIPLFRRQIVSQRRMQLLMPELKEVQKRYKGDRQKAMAEQQRLYKDRGVSPLSGCLPSMLQLVLLIPMYTVISQGLTSWNPIPMLTVFGVQVVPLTCPDPPNLDAAGHALPCIDTIVPWLANLDVSKPEVVFTAFGFGISILAIVSALLQVVQTRMVMTTSANADQQARLQNQMFLFIPLISILYGGIIPAGLFIYWITTTVFSIVQQYLIVGWGGLFPVFGWTPGFAQGHTPRFPVAMPTAVAVAEQAARGGHQGKVAKPAPTPTRSAAERAASADSTVRPRRGRQGRRGRRH